MQHLNEVLDKAVRAYGPRPALRNAGEGPNWSWTYAELQEQTARLAAWLRTQGVRPGARVILWAPNSPWWVAAYFATLRLGGLVVPLDVRSTPEFVARVAAQTAPVLGLLGHDTPPGWETTRPSALLESLADLPPVPAPPLPPELGPASPAVIAYTSGTTGEPKGVILTHDNILADVAGVRAVAPRYPAYRLLSVLPLSHMLEEVVGLLVPLLLGATITYTASRQSTVLFRIIQAQQITTLLLVPEALDLIMRAIEQKVAAQGKTALWGRMQTLAGRLPPWGRRLLFRQVHQQLGGHLDFLMCGGAFLTPELNRKWDLLGVPVLQGYGTTEAAPVVTLEPAADRNPAAVGKPIQGVQLRIAADGEILVRGPNITPGYWQNPEATAAAFADDWYKTGDLGELDDRGFLHLKGRKSERIVLASGQKVYPDDIEQMLRTVPGVTDAAVVGMPTPHGPVVHAVVIPATPEASVAALVRQANARLGSHQQIQGYSTWPEADFPRTALRKVRRHLVLAAVREMQPAPAPASARPALGAAGAGPRSLVEIAAELAHVDPALLTPDATLGEAAGMDSLAQIELLASVERELGVHLDEANIGPTTTIGELLALIAHPPAVPRGCAAVSTPGPVPPPRPLDGPVALAGLDGQARWYHHVAQRSFRALYALFLRAEVRGMRHLPRGPAILCANHVGWADLVTPLLYLPLEPRIHVLGEEHVRDVSRGRAWLINGLEIMIPLDRSKPLAALHTMVAALRQGGSLLIYPEGTVRHTEGGLQGPLQEGAAEAAILAGVPLVPLGISGAADLWWRKRVTLRIGRPIDSRDFAGDLPARRAAMTQRLAAAMAALLPGERPQPGPRLLRHWMTHVF